jgi:magnesium-transporting ATPase (P-type)
MDGSKTSSGIPSSAATASSAHPEAIVFPFFARSVEECIKELGCSDKHPKEGLSSSEAAARLEQYGPNQLTEKEKKSIWVRIWNQINNVLVGVLVFVAIISLVQLITADTTEEIITDAINIGLIVFVIV